MTLATVECANCGWSGKRKPGQIVTCPSCGMFAAFQIEDEPQEKSETTMAMPKQTDPHFRLRVPSELKARIEAAAAENNRSMNSEIVARLESTFDDALENRISRIEQLLERIAGASQIDTRK